ncbi:MAG: hypothetical protein ACT4PI_14905 [Actinomycetota bacterium]
MGTDDPATGRKPPAVPGRAIVWGWSAERAYIEPLLNQRFHFFLLTFSLVIAGAMQARSQVHLTIVLGLGATVTSMLFLVLRHTQKKVDRTIDEVHKEPNHPAAIVNEAIRGKSRKRFIGFWIPGFCVIALWAGFFLAAFDVLEAASQK